MQHPTAAWSIQRYARGSKMLCRDELMLHSNIEPAVFPLPCLVCVSCAAATSALRGTGCLWRAATRSAVYTSYNSGLFAHCSCCCCSAAPAVVFFLQQLLLSGAPVACRAPQHAGAVCGQQPQQSVLAAAADSSTFCLGEHQSYNTKCNTGYDRNTTYALPLLLPLLCSSCSNFCFEQHQSPVARRNTLCRLH
jgi:hypothetical protein